MIECKAERNFIDFGHVGARCEKKNLKTPEGRKRKKLLKSRRAKNDVRYSERDERGTREKPF